MHNVFLLGLNRVREYNLENDAYYQMISIRFAFIDPGRPMDGNRFEVPTSDLKQLTIDIKEPMTPDDLATALEMLAGAILRESNDRIAHNNTV